MGFTQRARPRSIENPTLGWTIQLGGTIVTINGSPFVLIADDLPSVIRYYKMELLERYNISVVSATSLEELDSVFDRHYANIDVIILDGCIPGNTLNTIDFIVRAREKGFTKPIIAASSSFEYRMMMIEAGCMFEAEKEEAPKLAAQLLPRK